MSEKEKIKQELEDLSPLLANLRRKSDQPFQVPDHYFQSMQEDVLRRVAQEQIDNQAIEPGTNWLDRLVEQLQWLLQPRYVMAMATVAILIVAGAYFLQPSSPAAFKVGMTELTQEDITDYIASNIEDFEVDLLVEAMGEEIDPTLLPKLELDESELEDYLEGIIDEVDLEELEELF